MLTRRRFLNETVVLILIPITAACSNDGNMNDEGSCDGAGATSSIDAGHSHFVCVAGKDLANPPSGGARYTTSNEQGHTHEIEVSAEDLGTIGGGGTVTVQATVVQGHSHTFMLSNASAWLERAPKRARRALA